MRPYSGVFVPHRPHRLLRRLYSTSAEGFLRGFVEYFLFSFSCSSGRGRGATAVGYFWAKPRSSEVCLGSAGPRVSGSLIFLLSLCRSFVFWLWPPLFLDLLAVKTF